MKINSHGLSASDENTEFIHLDADLPGRHRHVLNSTTKLRGPKFWMKLVHKDSQRLRNVFNRLTSKTHDTKPLLPDELGAADKEKTLENAYGRRCRVIGQGAYGTVSIHYRRRDNSLFAIKEFHRRAGQTTEELRDRALAEFAIARGVRHTNFVRTLDMLQERDGAFFQVMEFCAAGTLSSLVEDAGPLGPVEAACFTKQLVRGIQHLHDDLGIAHCDLKPENLLLTAHGTLKISDFGCSQFIRVLDGDGADSKHLLMVAGVRGSRPYIAPEEYTSAEFDGRAADVWACGVIYMSIRLCRHLWYAAKENDECYTRYVLGRRLEEGFPPLEALETEDCRNVIYSMLDPVPGRRLTAAQFLASEWGRSIELCEAGRGLYLPTGD